MTTDADAAVGLAYLAFEVSDLQAWDAFLTRFVGATASDAVGDALRYRVDSHLARLIVHPGPLDDVAAIGFELPDAAALAAAVERARAEGSEVTPLSKEELAIRAVADGFLAVDPGGNPIELVVGPERAPTSFASALVPSGFVTGDLGLGHLALRAADIGASRRWFERVLGFRLSDRIECDLPGGLHVDLSFLHVNRRHHTLALGQGLPKRLNHFMLELHSLDEVGAALDRARLHRVPIFLGLGKHPNDHMVSFYCMTPSGFELEIGFGGRTIDDEATWEARVYDRISDWGHAPPPRARRASPGGTEEKRER